MILTEAEGKELLKLADVMVPHSHLVTSIDQLKKIDNFPVFVKAQVLHGNRALQGLVKKANNKEELKKIASQMFKAKDEAGQPITELLVEEALNFDQQFYLSLGYSTRSRSIEVRFSAQGGEGMDDRGESLVTLALSSLETPSEFKPYPELLPIVKKIYQVFLENDATLVEINPLVKHQNDWYCLDAKIELEDVAKYRHPDWENYSERSDLGRPPTQREQLAHQVSRSDHRGVAGESFFEFEGGEIGVMASGGGASTLAMDALMAEGLKPANYTEYSGNPTREKVKALTDVVLSIPNLKGLYVVGSNANFTDIFETLSGVVDGLLESEYLNQPGFALLIRRGGPRWEEAFDMVKERLSAKKIKIKLFGPEFPLVATAVEMKKLVAK